MSLVNRRLFLFRSRRLFCLVILSSNHIIYAAYESFLETDEGAIAEKEVLLKYKMDSGDEAIGFSAQKG